MSNLNNNTTQLEALLAKAKALPTANEEGGYNEGYEAGKRAEYDAFWDALQNYGNRERYDYAFYQWGSETLHPKYKVASKNTNTLNQTFTKSKIKKIEAEYFDFSLSVPLLLCVVLYSKQK